MKLKPLKGSWILVVLVMVGVIFPFVFQANASGSIAVSFYDNFGFNGSPPLPDESGRPLVGTTTYSNIDQNFDSQPMFGLYEDFIVKYEGYITSPISGNITFWPQADDGTQFILDGILIDFGNWVDKGGGGYQTDPQFFIEGESKAFTYWYYENGGGANTSLYWNIGNGWEIVPPSAFSLEPVAPTTTTLAPYFNAPNNLIALPKVDGSVDLSWETPDLSNVEPYIYSISFYDMDTGSEIGGWGIWEYATKSSITFGHWMFDGSNPVTTGYGPVRFKVRAGNAACVGEAEGQCLYGPWAFVDINVLDPALNTTTSTTTTTTTTIPPVPLTTTTEFPTTTTTTTTVVATTTTTTTIAATVPTTVPSTATTTTIPEVKEIVSEEEAIAFASNPEVLAQVSKEEAEKIFESINTSEITEEEKTQITQAVQNAPEEVRESFEQEINIYADGFDDYIPVGSNIDVGTRRSLIAVTTVLSTVAVASTSPSTGPSGNSGNPSGGGSGPDPNSGAKKEKEDESEEEDVPEIEGPEGNDKEGDFTKNSIFKYQEETMKRTFSPWGFVKKFAKETAALAFTISGTVIVFATLSGETRQITLIATGTAFFVHYINAMLKNDE